MEEALELSLLLEEIRIRGASLNLSVDAKELVLLPAVEDESFIESIRTYFSVLLELLPGFCDNCSAWTIKRTASYWGARPHYCYECLVIAVGLLDKYERWPSVEIPEFLP